MSQESNIESSSSDKPKKRLTLKRTEKGESSASPFGGGASSTHVEGEKSVEQAGKSVRMSLKKRDEPVAEAVASQDTCAKEEAAVSPSKPVEDVIPPTEEPVEVQSDGLLSEVKTADKVSPAPFEVEMAPPPSPEEKPQAPKIPTPPPGFKVRNDSDDAVPAANSELPPPVKPTQVGTRPAMPIPDLMEEAIQDSEKKSGTAKHVVKGVFVVVLMLVILGGAVYLLRDGLLGLLGEEASGPEATVSRTEAKTPSSAPAGALNLAKQTVAKVNERASTEGILPEAEVANAPAQQHQSTGSVVPVASPSTPVETVVEKAPVLPVSKPEPMGLPKTGVSDPAVRRWIEAIRPSGIGRGQMLLDGERYRLGEIVNPQLGVRWVELDIQLGVMTFEDRNGVRYEKDF